MGLLMKQIAWGLFVLIFILIPAFIAGSLYKVYRKYFIRVYPVTPSNLEHETSGNKSGRA